MGLPMSAAFKAMIILYRRSSTGTSAAASSQLGRTSDATRRRRPRPAGAAAGLPAAAPAPCSGRVPPGGRVGEHSDLDAAALAHERASLGQRDRLVEVVGGDHRIAAERPDV